MPRHPDGNGYHEAFEPDGGENIGAEEERCPQHCEYIYLCPARDDAMFTESPDVLT